MRSVKILSGIIALVSRSAFEARRKAIIEDWVPIVVVTPPIVVSPPCSDPNSVAKISTFLPRDSPSPAKSIAYPHFGPVPLTVGAGVSSTTTSGVAPSSSGAPVTPGPSPTAVAKSGSAASQLVISSGSLSTRPIIAPAAVARIAYPGREDDVSKSPTRIGPFSLVILTGIRPVRAIGYAFSDFGPRISPG